MIPWSDFEDAHARNFKAPSRTEEALSVWVALGTQILQTRLKLVDAEVPSQVMENSYLQYFLGFDSFEDTRPPFDSSLIMHFSKCFVHDILMEINNMNAMKEFELAEDNDGDDDHEGSRPSEPSDEGAQISFDDIRKKGS